jgi:hypothetical protein
VGSSCPIPTTHKRLSDAHRLWHQALDSYDDPDGFRANLNSAVQIFRSVTNMLQKEKRNVPGFPEWYGEWQERMRADDVMRWVDAARTRVFHQGDLETYSTARVRVRYEWASAKVLSDEDVSPFTDTETLARGLAEGFAQGFAETFGSGPPEHLLLEVERRWVDRGLPDWELLGALAHAYAMLSRIVGEAHARAGRQYVTADYTHGEPDVVDLKHLGGRLPCMVTAPERRTATIKLHTGELVEAQYVPLAPYDPARGDEAAEKYGLKAIDRAASTDPFDLADMYMQIARRALLVDGHVVPITFLFGPNGGRSIVHPAEDRAEKFLNWDRIAAEVEASGSTALVTIAEAWFYRLPGSELEAMIQRPRREEQVSVLAASKDGRYRMWSMFFERSPAGRILPGPIEVMDLEEPPNFLLAVADKWSRFP